eukprot:scaffold2866_cov140-Skeletonema_dohrnii-CCMP3373.AAC.1
MGGTCDKGTTGVEHAALFPSSSLAMHRYNPKAIEGLWRLGYLCRSSSELVLLVYSKPEETDNSTSQKPFCTGPKLSNVRHHWGNITYCPSLPLAPAKTQSLSKLCKMVRLNSYVDSSTKVPVDKMSAKMKIQNHLNSKNHEIVCYH